MDIKRMPFRTGKLGRLTIPIQHQIGKLIQDKFTAANDIKQKTRIHCNNLLA